MTRGQIRHELSQEQEMRNELYRELCERKKTADRFRLECYKLRWENKLLTASLGMLNRILTRKFNAN